MIRLLLVLPMLVGTVTFSAAALALSEQEARTIIQGLDEAQISAEQHHDITAAGALFTEDAVEVTPGGLVSGRTEIEKFLAAGLKDYAPDMGKIDSAIPISDGTILGAGSWGGTYHSPDGPVHLGGYWSQTLVRVGNTWEIRQEAFNNAPPPPEPKK